MKLLHLVTKEKTEEWPKGEAWKVMQFLTKKYHPNDLQARVQLRKRLGNLKLSFKQDPSDLFEELTSIEHAFAWTKAKISEIYLIGAVYAAAPKEYIPILTMEESIRGEDLELKHLNELMGKLWRHSGGKQGHLVVKTELVLNAFAGQCYVHQYKGLRANQCPNQEANKLELVSMGKNFNGTCNHCGRQGHKKQNC